MTAPIVRIVHALPRRVHVRARALAGRREACSRAATLLAREPSNERVSAREITGSIIVERQEGVLDPAEISARLAAILAAMPDDSGRPLAEPEPVSSKGPTRIARAVAHAVAGINRDVSAVFGREADLGTLFSLALGVGGLIEVLVSEELPGPSWFNALWWSVRSFMTFNIDAVESEMDGHRAADLDAEPNGANGDNA